VVCAIRRIRSIRRSGRFYSPLDILRGRAQTYSSQPHFFLVLFNCAPHVFLSLRTTQHDFGGRPSGVLIKRKLWKPADARTYGEYASKPIPEPARCSYRSYLLPEPEILATAKSSCAKGVPKRSQMSVCPSDVCRVLFEVNSLLAETEITLTPPPPAEDAISERPNEQGQKNMRGATCPRG
jgi:hypothetical protein